MINDRIYNYVGKPNRNDPIDFYLNEASKQSVKGIVDVDMYEGKAVNPVQDGVRYLCTSALNGCQACSIIIKGKNGNPIAIMTHYPDDSTDANIAEIERLIKQNRVFMDETAKPIVALVLPEDSEDIKDKLKSSIDSQFPQGVEFREIPYKHDPDPDYSKKSYEYIIEFPENKGELIKYQTHGKNFGDFGEM